jgi:hypothetical protein
MDRREHLVKMVQTLEQVVQVELQAQAVLMAFLLIPHHIDIVIPQLSQIQVRENYN